MRTLWICFRDTPERRAAIQGDAPHWLLGPYAALRKRDLTIRTNLDSKRRAVLSSFCSWIDRMWIRSVGVGLGDLERGLWVAQTARRSDVVMATSDTTGLALAIFRYWGVLRAPLVYTSIGLLERLNRLNGKPRWRRFYLRVLSAVHGFLAHGWEEARRLRELFPEKTVIFVPYGCDAEFFSPLSGNLPLQTEILSLGMDEQRDWSLLRDVAVRLPHRTFRIVGPLNTLGSSASWSSNVEIKPPVDPKCLRDCYAAAQTVALPVRSNSYSGATTTLLQAMAMAKPVVVSRVNAIAEGYGFEDGRHLFWAEPGRADEFAERLEALLKEPETARHIGAQAREHVLRSLSFDHMADRLLDALRQFQLH